MLQDIALALGALSLIAGGLLYFAKKYTKTKTDDKWIGKFKDAIDWARDLLSFSKKAKEETKDDGDGDKAA